MHTTCKLPSYIHKYLVSAVAVVFIVVVMIFIEVFVRFELCDKYACEAAGTTRGNLLMLYIHYLPQLFLASFSFK